MLMRASLWQTPTDHFEMTPWEYKQVMDYSEKQCVLGIIIDCLRSNDIGLQKKCVIHMLKLQNTLELENRRLNENAKQLAKLMDDHGYDYAVVKGQTLAQLYPKPLLRVPGDIDFYCPPQHYQQALELIASAWHATYEGHPKGHHQAFVHNGTHYELHNRIGQLYQKRKNRQWQQLTDNSPRATVSIDGHDIATLSPTLHVFYLFLHLYNHLLIAGVGLKQVCDVAMMLHGNKAQIDRDELCRLLSDFGLEKAFRALGSILTAHLGLPSDEFPYALTPTDQRYGAYLLEAIFRHGSFGFHHRRYHKVSLAHTMESLMIQARHVFRFAPLSYSYTLHWALHAVRSKLCRTMK